MTATIITLTRLFRFGATTLDDIDPNMTPEEVLKAYSSGYPFLAHAALGEPTVEGDTLVYPVQKREVQTKGARQVTLDEAERALAQWGEASSEHIQSVSPAWHAIATIVNDVLAREPTPLTDAMLVPML